MNKIRSLILACPLLLLTTTSSANEPVWYQFEVILFSYTNTLNTDSETWPEIPGSPDYDNPVATIIDKLETSSSTSPVQPVNEPTTTEPLPSFDKDNFLQLADDQLILTKEAGAIKRSSQRKLLLHIGWIQTMHDRNSSRPVIFNAGKQFTIQVPDPNYIPEELPESLEYADTQQSQLQANPETGNETTQSVDNSQYGEVGSLVDLTQASSEEVDAITHSIPMIPQQVREIDGTITISIGRYLHFWSDLLIRRAVTDPASINTTIDENSAFDNLQTFRYQDHRRMRSKELHYIDNPSFGILIYALPYKTVVDNKE